VPVHRRRSRHLALTDLETTLLDRLVSDQDPGAPRERTPAVYLTKVARLGGYLARDPPPGTTVMWRGMSRLANITIGAQLVGN
jgi:hypothetical protein